MPNDLFASRALLTVSVAQRYNTNIFEPIVLRAVLMVKTQLGKQFGVYKRKESISLL